MTGKLCMLPNMIFSSQGEYAKELEREKKKERAWRCHEKVMEKRRKKLLHLQKKKYNDTNY